MPRQVLSLDTIGDIDHGALRIAVNNALKLVTQDLADRPALDKARKVVLEIALKPVMDVNSAAPVLDHAETSWSVATKAPGVGSQNVVMKPQQDGQLFFHSDLPDEPDEETLMDDVERRRTQRGSQRET